MPAKGRTGEETALHMMQSTRLMKYTAFTFVMYVTNIYTRMVNMKLMTCGACGAPLEMHVGVGKYVKCGYCGVSNGLWDIQELMVAKLPIPAIRQQMIQHFDLEVIALVCLDLKADLEDHAYDFENLQGSTLNMKCAQLILACERRLTLWYMLETLSKYNRPFATWISDVILATEGEA